VLIKTYFKKRFFVVLFFFLPIGTLTVTLSFEGYNTSSVEYFNVKLDAACFSDGTKSLPSKK